MTETDEVIWKRRGRSRSWCWAQRQHRKKSKKANAREWYAQRKVIPFGGRFQVYFHSKFTIYKVLLKMEYSLGLEGGYRGWGKMRLRFCKGQEGSIHKNAGCHHYQNIKPFYFSQSHFCIGTFQQMYSVLIFSDTWGIKSPLWPLRESVKAKSRRLQLELNLPLADKIACCCD